MKKLIAFLAASMLLTCSFASCGKSDDDSESTSKKSKHSASSEVDEDASEESSEEDTEEDTEESTKKSKKHKEKSTEDETEEDTEDETEDDTEEDTTKKSKKEKTTKEKTSKEKSTGKIDPEDLPGKTGGDVIGKWAIDEETLSEIMGDSDLHGMEVTDCSMEFDDEGVCTIRFSVDMSELMCIKDEEPNKLYVDEKKTPMDGKSFNLGGISCPIYDFNGTSFNTGVNEKVLKFERDKKSDDVYGIYKIPEGMGSNKNKDKGFIEFEKSGKAYMTYSETEDYVYDEKTGTITSNDKDDSPVYVRFEDDDTMIIANDDGVKGTLNRLD